MLVHDLLGLIDEADEIFDPALVVKLVALLLGPLVDEDDPKRTCEESGLAQPLDERLYRKLKLFEDLRIGLERDRRPSIGGRSHNLDLARRNAARELLPVELAVASYLRD